MRLYDLNKNSKIYCECSDGSEYIIFDHPDGMYSFCRTEKGAIVHPANGTEMIKHKDGYKFSE